MAIIKTIDNRSLAAMALQNEEIAQKMYDLGMINQEMYEAMKEVRENGMDRASIKELERRTKQQEHRVYVAGLANANFARVNNDNLHRNHPVEGLLEEPAIQLEQMQHELETRKSTVNDLLDQADQEMRAGFQGAKGIGIACSSNHANDVSKANGSETLEQSQLLDEVANRIDLGEPIDPNYMSAFLSELEGYAPVHKGIAQGDAHQFDMTQKFVEVTSAEDTFAAMPTFSMDATGELGPGDTDVIGEQETQEQLTTVAIGKLQKQRQLFPWKSPFQQVAESLPNTFGSYLSGLRRMDADGVTALMRRKQPGTYTSVRTLIVNKGLDSMLATSPMAITPQEFQANFGIDLNVPENAALKAYKEASEVATTFVAVATAQQASRERIDDRRGHFVAGVAEMGPLGAITGIIFAKKKLVEESEKPLPPADAPAAEIASAQRKHDKAIKELAALSGFEEFDDDKLEESRKEMFDDALRLYCEESLRLGIQEFAPTRTKGFTEENVGDIRLDLAERATELLFCAGNAEEAKRARFIIETAAASRKQLVDEVRQLDQKHKRLEAAKTPLAEYQAKKEAEADKMQEQLLSDQHRTARQQKKLENDLAKAQMEAGKAADAQQKLVEEQHKIHAKERKALTEAGIREAGDKFFKNIDEEYIAGTYETARNLRTKKHNPYANRASLTAVTRNSNGSTNSGNDYEKHSVGMQLGRTVRI